MTYTFGREVHLQIPWSGPQRALCTQHFNLEGAGAHFPARSIAFNWFLSRRRQAVYVGVLKPVRFGDECAVGEFFSAAPTQGGE